MRKSKIQIVDVGETPRILEVSEVKVRKDDIKKSTTTDISTELEGLGSLGFRKGMWTEWYVHAKKEVGNTVYQAWIEVSKMNIGKVICMGVQTNDEKLIVKLARKMKEIFDELKNEGYVECD